MKAFVTGSTGFVGSHVARLLAEQGAELRLLLRKTSPTDLIEGIKADRVIGDLTDPESLKKGMAGGDAAVHLADHHRRLSPNPDSVYRVNVVDVREVARGHLFAFERAKPGERYILGGENLTLKQLLDKLAAISGVPSPTKKVPHGVALGFAYLDEFFTGRVLKKEPRATVDAVRMGKKKMFASSAKAERDLGWRVAPIDAALRRACEWFIAHGYVRGVKEL